MVFWSSSCSWTSGVLFRVPPWSLIIWVYAGIMNFSVAGARVYSCRGGAHLPFCYGGGGGGQVFLWRSWRRCFIVIAGRLFHRRGGAPFFGCRAEGGGRARLSPPSLWGCRAACSSLKCQRVLPSIYYCPSPGEATKSSAEYPWSTIPGVPTYRKLSLL